jgi:hypothetical protein
MGGLIQLVAVGAQDIWVTGNPQITYWKTVYKHHTNFAVESIEQDITGSSAPGSRVVFTIARNGDLLKGLYLQYNPSQLLPNNPNIQEIASNLGHAIIDTIELHIGGQPIDRLYGKWLTIWKTLTDKNDIYGFQGQVGSLGEEPEMSSLYNKMAYTHKGVTYTNTILGTDNAPHEAYIPLPFWFSQNSGLAIPLIALMYHEVKVIIIYSKLENFVKCNNKLTVNFSSIRLFADYIFLDSQERRKFADDPHEYLIEQLQLQENPVDILYFKHPVKELIVKSNTFNNDTTLTLSFNEVERFTPRNIKYFTHAQVWESHSGVIDQSIGVYSFALKPEEHQPSGTCNFSRIKTAKIKIDNQPVDIYAINYNILRIMSGMGAIAFAN